MIRVKPGEGLRGGHRREAQRIMVNREGLNSPHVSSDREGNLGSAPSYSRQDRQQAGSAGAKGRRGGNSGDKKGNRAERH